MSDRDPLRFSDKNATTALVLKNALRGARGRGPSPATLSALAAKLPMAKGVVAPTIKIAVANAPGSTSILPAVLLGAGLGVVVSAVGLFWPSAPTQRTELAINAPPPRAIATARGTPVAPSPVEADSSKRSILVAPVAPVASTSTAATAKSGAVASQATAPDTKEGLDSTNSAPVGATPAPPEGLVSEAHLLSLAQAELSGNPAKALSLTEEHARRFPSGSLAQEREVVAIQALLHMGRSGDARARGERFLAAFPGSAHRRRIEALLAP